MKTHRVTYLIDVDEDTDPIDYEALGSLGAYDVDAEEVEPVEAPHQGGGRKPKAAS